MSHAQAKASITERIISSKGTSTPPTYRANQG
jgi:hypothetical protein